MTDLLSMYVPRSCRLVVCKNDQHIDIEYRGLPVTLPDRLIVLYNPENYIHEQSASTVKI